MGLAYSNLAEVRERLATIAKPARSSTSFGVGNPGHLLEVQLFNAESYEGRLAWRPSCSVRGIVRPARAAPDYDVGSDERTGAYLDGGNLPRHLRRRHPGWP